MRSSGALAARKLWTAAYGLAVVAVRIEAAVRFAAAAKQQLLVNCHTPYSSALVVHATFLLDVEATHSLPSPGFFSLLFATGTLVSLMLLAAC